MKITERLFLVISIGGLVFKILHLSGGNEMLMIGLTFLAGQCFFVGFALFNSIRLRKILSRASYNDISALRIWGSVALSMAVSIIIIGILFKLLRLEGASEMLTIGVPVTGIVLTIAFILYATKHPSDAGIQAIDTQVLDGPDIPGRNVAAKQFYQNIFIRGGIALALGVALLLAP